MALAYNQDHHHRHFSTKAHVMVGIINVAQAGVVAFAGVIASDATVSALIGGFFLLVNGAATVLLTRYLEKRDERRKKKRKSRRVQTRSYHHGPRNR